MINFGNPIAFWFLFLLLPLLFLATKELRFTRDILRDIPLISYARAKKKCIIKYSVSALVLILLIAAFADPLSSSATFKQDQKTGEIIFLADVSGSMAARKDIDSPHRLDRAKSIIADNIDAFPAAKITICEFAGGSSCLSPLTNDHVYLRRTLERVVDIYSATGIGSSLTNSIVYSADKFSEDENPKILVIFTDAERFSFTRSDYLPDENKEISNLRSELKRVNGDIKFVFVGVGEKDGATIPLQDNNKFTGRYAELNGEQYVTKLNEEFLLRLAKEVGGNYFSEKQDIAGFISQNLKEETVETRNDRNLSIFFIIPAAILWIVLARKHFI